jgi:c(7)-type cytochrome triheme protein
MRKAFFFSIGIIGAACLAVFFSDTSSESARRKRPPRLRGKQAIVFPQAKDSEHLPVAFSHSSHARFGFKKCTACHNDEVFTKDQELGVNNINMDDIYKGKWCGHCHNGKLMTADDKPVFAPRDGNIDQCVLCHNVKTWTAPAKGKGWNPPAGVKPLTGKIGEEKKE